ncbi:MAG: hypothetical protein PHN22_05015 [Candidatus ainarchaeum sp.]|nr:hypothetical protein [Candidatus ainarchaeum sp.]
MNKLNNWININKIEIIFLSLIIFIYIITQWLINTNNVNETNGIIIILITTLITIIYLFIKINRLVKELAKQYTKKEKLKFNGIILSILIIPTVNMISKLIIYKNNNFTLYDSFEFMLTIALSMAVIIFLKNKKLI